MQSLVNIVDNDDGRIDHSTDGDRNAAERHNVGRQTHIGHWNERQQDRNGQGQDGDECRAHMQ